MTIEEIAADTRIRPLWDEIIAHWSITEKFDPNAKGWGSSQPQNGKAIIHTSKTAQPVESLAHELLHLWLQTQGYRRPRLMIWPTDQVGFGSHLMTFLDNELQHHRMFARFLAAGLDPVRFYADDDVKVGNYLSRQLGKNISDFRDLIGKYFTLVAPGGTLSDAQRDGFRRIMDKMNKGVFAEDLKTLDGILDDWRNDPGLNPEETIRRIIHLFESPAVAWVGYGTKNEFPHNGFFVDQSFEFTET